MTLGKKISTQRKISGLSQELLAEKCGITLRTIQRIENDKSIPRPYTLKVIADSLNLEMRDFEQNIISEQQTNIFPELQTNNGNLSKINLINSSTLLGVLFPFLNLIAPTVLLIINKNGVVRKKGRVIISFQILWSLFSSIILFIIFYLHFKITGEFISGGISPELMAYIFLFSLNVFFVIKNSMLLKNNDTQIYSSFPCLL